MYVASCPAERSALFLGSLYFTCSLWGSDITVPGRDVASIHQRLFTVSASQSRVYELQTHAGCDKLGLRVFILCVQVLVDVWLQFVRLYPASLEATAAAAENSPGAPFSQHASAAGVHSQQWEQQLLADRYASHSNAAATCLPRAPLSSLPAVAALPAAPRHI
jgi:hypothetical protein